MGFVYFQGYFFAKPEVLKNKEISSSQMIYMQLIMEVNRAEFEINKLESLIKQDVAISYKLIKYLNSAYYSRLQPLSSIRQAIAFLGERGTKMFVSLIATSKLSENKPDELIRVSCIRARFLELLGKELKQDQGTFFLLGLFSLLDAMLDASMESLMKQLPISAEITQALVYKTGPLFPYLQLIQLYEAGQMGRAGCGHGSAASEGHKNSGFLFGCGALVWIFLGDKQTLWCAALQSFILPPIIYKELWNDEKKIYSASGLSEDLYH